MSVISFHQRRLSYCRRKSFALLWDWLTDFSVPVKLLVEYLRYMGPEVAKQATYVGLPQDILAPTSLSTCLFQKPCIRVIGYLRGSLWRTMKFMPLKKCCRNTTSIVILILITFEVLVLEVGLRVVSVCPCIYNRTEVLVFTVVYVLSGYVCLN